MGKLIQIDKSLKVTLCVCGLNTFYVLAHPDLAGGGAQVLAMVCAGPKCGVMVDISDNGRVGSKKIYVDQAKPEQSYTVDDDGKKHYHIKCETGNLGVKLN